MAVRSLASAAGAVSPPVGDTMVISGPGHHGGYPPAHHSPRRRPHPAKEYVIGADREDVDCASGPASEVLAWYGRRV